MPSSVIRTYAYDEHSRRLDVCFVSGLRYSYTEVPKSIIEGLQAAPSLGRFFTEHIRDRYPCERRRR